MNNFKDLFKNIGWLTIGNLGTKLITFLLIPLYTNLLTTSEYGIFDIINTTIMILVPFLLLDIGESVFRFIMDGKTDKAAVITYSMKVFSTGVLVLFLFIIINYKWTIVPVLKEYAIAFFTLYVVTAYNSIVTNYARATDHIFELSVSGVMSTVTIVTLNIVLLVLLKWGIKGYFIANILGIFVQDIYLSISTRIFYYVKTDNTDGRVGYYMLEYSKPLIINSMAWWVNNLSDRYIVIAFCGMSENGIYSIAYKIPSLLNVFQSIFSQAWTIFSIKEFDTTDERDVFSKAYGIYHCFVIFLCTVLIILDKPLARLLYAKGFYLAWRYAPFLLLSSMFGALSAYIGGIFTAAKQSKDIMKTTLIGAGTNLVLNIILTPIMGALGAAIATAISYFIVWMFRMAILKRQMNIQIKLHRDLGAYCLLIILIGILLTVTCNTVILGIQIMGIVVLIVLYKEDIMRLLVFIKSSKRG